MKAIIMVVSMRRYFYSVYDWMLQNIISCDVLSIIYTCISIIFCVIIIIVIIGPFRQCHPIRQCPCPTSLAILVVLVFSVVHIALGSGHGEFADRGVYGQLGVGCESFGCGCVVAGDNLDVIFFKLNDQLRYFRRINFPRIIVEDVIGKVFVAQVVNH